MRGGFGCRVGDLGPLPRSGTSYGSRSLNFSEEVTDPERSSRAILLPRLSFVLCSDAYRESVPRPSPQTERARVHRSTTPVKGRQTTTDVTRGRRSGAPRTLRPPVEKDRTRGERPNISTDRTRSGRNNAEWHPWSTRPRGCTNRALSTGCRSRRSREWLGLGGPEEATGHG